MDADGFFSTGYKALATEESPFYHSLSGTPTFADGAITFGNARFSIGNTTPAVATTGSDIITAGELDLSEPYRVSFCVVDWEEASANRKLQVYVDNNTSGGANSLHASIGSTASRIYNADLNTLARGQRVVINSSVGTSTSFLQLRVESSGTVTIDDLWIGYQSDTSTEPAAESCVGANIPVPDAPAAPSVTAGDGSITVNWSAVSGATSYEVIYNTSNSTEGAIEFSGNPLTATTATITGLTNGTTYYVFVRASNATGDSGYSSGASASPKAAEAGEAGSWIGEALVLAGAVDIAPAGSVESNEETSVTITATGGNMSSSAYQLFFAHQQISESNFAFTARIAAVSGATEGVGNSYRFGLMVIENLDFAVSYADLGAWADAGFYVTGENTVVGSRAHMKEDGTRSRSDIASLAVGDYVRIEVYDDGDKKRVRRLYSTDGIEFTQANTTIDFKATAASDSWYVGVYAAPGANELTIEFTDIAITPL